MSHRFKFGVFMLMAILALAACQSSAPVSAPTPTNAAPAASATAAATPAIVPTNTLPPASTSASEALSSIFGWVWHDECAVSGEGSTNKVSDGCVQSDGSYHANGIKDGNEQPIGGVRVKLGAGACPSIELLGMETITTDISYGFTSLKPGTYCISIDPLSEPSSSKLLPGNWTYPAFAAGPRSPTIKVTLRPSSEMTGSATGLLFRRADPFL